MLFVAAASKGDGGLRVRRASELGVLVCAQGAAFVLCVCVCVCVCERRLRKMDVCVCVGVDERDGVCVRE